MEEILEINGVTYIKKDAIADIKKERDEAVKSLNMIREIVGVSFKDLKTMINEDIIKEQSKVIRPTIDGVKRVTRKRTDIFEPVESSKKLFKIRYMDNEGVFHTKHNRALKVTIKHVFEVQKALHNNVTNGEIDDLAKKLGINYQIIHRLIYNYQEHVFDKFIAQWNKQTQPTVGAKNKPIQNNPEKRKESGLYA